jgi:poly(A) polymerase
MKEEKEKWRSLRDSNPCYRRERAMSLAARRREHKEDSNTGFIIAMQNDKTPQDILTERINPNAVKVLNRLMEQGYSAYLVGGGVRDLLLNFYPKDFDIATDARPQEIKKLFRNCILIGKRFRLAHIRFGQEIIEVATFRADHSKGVGSEAVSKNGLILRDNVYGTLEEDAIRRDFTINALYYNIADSNITDLCGGLKDLQKKQLRMIGDPEKRYQEDPVRLLRVIRFAAKLDFKIEKKTEQPLFQMGYLLNQSAPARLFDEMIKLFLKGYAKNTFELLLKYDLFKQLFPSCGYMISRANHYPNYPIKKLLLSAMKNSDDRIKENKTLNPGFLFSVILWYPLQIEVARGIEYGLSDPAAMEEAISSTIKEQNTATSIPKRFIEMISEVWRLQFLFGLPKTQRLMSRIVSSLRFRAGYDFLLLREQAGETTNADMIWWKRFYEADEDEKNLLIEELPKNKKRVKSK